MTNKDFVKYGELLYGPSWRQAMANALGKDIAIISKASHSKCRVPANAKSIIAKLMEKRIAQMKKELIKIG